MRRALAALALALLAAPLRAACPQVKPVIVGKTQAYADALGSGLCFISVDPSYTPTMVYRSYALFGDGLLMVFSSYGPQEGSQYTSAREFYFFPRRGTPELRVDEKAGKIEAVMANGDVVAFRPDTSDVKSVGRGEVTVSPRVDPDERGGVEFPRYGGLMLDAGFARGHSPADARDGRSVLRSAYGQLCTVQNSEIFAYASGDHALKYTDAELSAWLAVRCPGLYVGF